MKKTATTFHINCRKIRYGQYEYKVPTLKSPHLRNNNQEEHNQVKLNISKASINWRVKKFQVNCKNQNGLLKENVIPKRTLFFSQNMSFRE